MLSIEINRGMFIAPRLSPVSAWTGHIPFAGWVVEALRPNMFVELGAHSGASFFAFCQAVQEGGLNTRCYAIDTWEGDEHSGHYGEDVYASALEHQQKNYGAFSELMRLSFDEAVSSFNDGSIDLLHIDGLHTYDAVKHDFETWLPKLSNRGVVLFHDTCVRERNFGVWKLWDELQGVYPGFEFTHTHGLGVLLVGTEVPASIKDLASRFGTDAACTNALFGSLGELVSAKDALAEYARREYHLKGDSGHLQGLLAERDAALEKERQESSALRAELERRMLGCDEIISRIREAQEILVKNGSVVSSVAGWLADIRQQQEAGSNQVAEVAVSLVARLSDLQNAFQTRADSFDERLMEANSIIAQQCSELEKLRAECLGSRNQIARIEGTLSWRLTAPFRALAHVLASKR